MRVLNYWFPPVILFLINLIIFNLGIDFVGLDVGLHFLGGTLVGWSILKTKLFYRPYDPIDLLLVTSLVMVVAVCWEIYEYILPLLGIGAWNSLGDTLCDLSIGYLGGWFAALATKK